MRNNSKKIITRDSWGRPEGDKWFGFDPERKEYTEKHFTYEDKEARYKKKNDEWFVSNENTNGFVPLKDPRGNRAKELERNAKEVKRMSSFEASEKESAEEIAKTRDFRNVVEKGSEIFTGFPGKEKNQYEFRNGNWYEPNPEVEKAIKRAEEDYLPISRIGGGTMTSPTGIGEDFSGEAKSKRSLDAIKDIPKTRVIKDDDRVRALNKQFGKNASLDEDYETFSNYDNSPEKSKNKYRVKDGSWERWVYGAEEWSPIENEGSIGALNRRYGKNVEVPKKVKIEEARDISPFLKINKNYLSQTEESAIKKLYKDFSNLGFEFEQEGMLTDYIKVIPKNKDVAPMTFSFDDPKGLDAARLRQYLQSNAEYDSNNSVVNEIRSNVRTNAFNKAIGEDGEVIEGSRADKVGVSKFIDHNNKYYESKEYKDNFKKLNFVEQKEEIERRQMENKPIENKDILPYGDFAVWIGLVDKYQGTPEDLKKLKESEKKLYNSEEYKVIYANKRDEYIKEKKKNNEKLLDAYEIALDSRDPKKIKEAKEKIEAGTFVATMGKNINYVSKQQQDYSDEIKNLYKSFEKNDDDYRNRKISAEVYQDRYETLESKRDQLKVVAKEIDTDQKRTTRLTGEYITEKAKYGGFWGNLVNEFIVSADKVAELGVKLDPAEKAKTSKESQIITPEEMKYYKSDALRKGGFTEEEIKNIKANQVKLKSIQQNERMLIEAFGSDLTTEESKQNLGFFQQALVGVAGSLPAMLTRAIPVVGQAAAFVSLADLSMSQIEKEMLTDPDFQTTTAFDRAKVSVPYGIVMGALENFGLNRLTKGQSYLLGKGILGNIAKNLPESKTREALINIANKEIKNIIGKGVLKVVAGTLAEGETGAIQTLFADIGIKKAYNYLRAAYNTEEDLKKLTGGEAFSTPKTLMEGLSAVGEGSLAEAIGGFAMSTVIVNSQLLINGNLSLYNKEDLNFLEDFTSDEQFKKIIVADLKNKMIQGTMTKSQAESALNDIDLVAGVFNSIDENLPEIAKMEAFNLINKRNRLEKEKQGKDPALSKGITDKIKEINDKLTKLPLKVQEFNGKERLKVLEKALKRKRKDKDIIIVEGKKISRTEAETEYKDLDEKLQSIISEFNAPVVETTDTIADIELNQINQKQKDAIQEQTAGEVPVQPTTAVGEEVVQGEPTAEPQVLTEEGKAEEEVTPSETTKQMTSNDYKVISKKVLDDKELNTVRASLRASSPDSFSLEILDAIAKKESMYDTGNDELNQLIDDAIENGLSIGTIANLILEDDVITEGKGIDSKRKAIDYALNIGGKGTILKSGQQAIIEEGKAEEKVTAYRAEEQAELLKAIPKIESYKVNGKIDKTKMPKTVLAKYNKIYEKYDALISPLLEPVVKAKAPSNKKQGDVQEVPKTEKTAFNEGVESVQQAAQEYKDKITAEIKEKQKNYQPERGNTAQPKLFERVSKMIADAYQSIKNEPTKQEVKVAYDAMMDETKDQYNFIVSKGLKVIRHQEAGEPYSNSKEMLQDIRENNTLRFLPNEVAFGQGDVDVSDNIGLQPSGVKLEDGYELTNSEMFRVVHDYFGHGILGNQFGAIGEENATLQHLDLYSDTAAPAVIFQTRGQNSWVNFSGVNAEANQLRKEARELKKQGKLEEANILLEKAEKMFKFAEPKIAIFPTKFNFRRYETARRISEQEDINSRPNKGVDDLPKLLEKYSKRSSGTRGVDKRNVRGTKRIGLLDLNVVAEYTLDKVISEGILKAFPNFKGVQKIYEITDGNAYREMMVESLKDNPFSASVTVHTGEKFNGMRMFVTEDGSTGITLTKEGFLGGGFSNPNAKRPQNLAQLMVIGIKEGATTAEAFDTILPDYYSNFGFKAVSRTAFNEQYKPMIKNGDAVKDWDFETYKKFNNGRPDVVFFIYDGGNRNTIEERLGLFDLYKNYEKENTESFDKDSYEKAEEVMNQQAVKRLEFELDINESEAPIATNQGVSITNKSAVDNIKTKTTDKVRVKVIEAAQRAVKTLQSVLPNFDIVIHENEESYNAAMKDRNGLEGSAGNFSYGLDGKGNLTGRIDINLNKANARTVAHEVAHGVMLKTFGDNPALFKNFRDRIASILKESSNKALMDFANQYVDNKTGKLLDVTYEEYLAELTAALAAEEGNLSATTLQKIATLINAIVSKITNGMLKPFEDVKDTKQVIEFFSNIANSIREGQDISNLNDDFSKSLYEPVNLNIKGELENKLPLSNRKPISKSSRGDFNLIPHPIIDKNTMVGKKYSVTMSDHTKVGEYKNDKTGVTVKNLMGGVFYPYIKGINDAGIAWASVTIKAAREMVINAANQDATLIYRMSRATGSRGNVNFNEIAFAELIAPVTNGKVTEEEFLRNLNNKLNTVSNGTQLATGIYILGKYGVDTNEKIKINKTKTVKVKDKTGKLVEKTIKVLEKNADNKRIYATKNVTKKELPSLDALKKALSEESFSKRGGFWSTILKDSWTTKSTGEWYKFLEKYNVTSLEEIVNNLAEPEVDTANDHDIVAAVKIAPPEYDKNGNIKIYTTREGLVNEAKGIYYIEAPDHPSYPYVVKGSPIGVLNEFNSITDYFPIINDWLESGRLNSPYKAVETMGKELVQKLKPTETTFASKAQLVYDETGFISVPSMIEIVKSNNPIYLGGVMEHIQEMGEKLRTGNVNSKDVAKSYLMAVSSIRSGDIGVDKFENSVGKKIDQVFLEPNNKIRTEGAMAFLLITDEGKRFLRNIELGKVDSTDRAFISTAMKPFGMFGVGESKFENIFGNPSEKQINLTNINEFNSLLKGGVKNESELFDAIVKLKGISQAKVGFVSNFLGIGTRGVIDAREIQGWLRGSVFQGIRTKEEAEIEKQLTKSNKSLSALQKEILSRMRLVGEAFGIDPLLAEYIGHHMIWDAVAKEKTTHDGLYLAMTQNENDFNDKLNKITSKSQLASEGKEKTEAEKITELNKKRDSAQKNTIGKNPKLGDITSDLGPLLKQVLNINAKLIPEDVFEDYRKVIEMLSGNRRILSPENRAEIEKKLNNIIRSIEFSNNKASDLKGRYDDFKVNNEDLDYSDSIKKMLEDGIISKEEFDFMKKYKSKIIEAEVKQKMTKEEDEDEKEELIAEIKDTTVTTDEFKGDEFRLERDFVNKFIETLKNSDLESLNNSDLNDLVKIIYNINNGFVNHDASQMLIKLESNIKEATLVEAIPDSYGGVVRRIQQWLRTLDVNIANIKLRIKNDKYGVGSNSLFNIDEMFGDFKTKRIFNSIFNESAKAQQTYQSEIKDVQGRLIEAENAVFNSFKKDGNALIKSQMKSMLYMIQLEYESNEGSKQTRPALAVLDAVIEFAKIKGVTEMSKQDLKVMQDIKKNFVVNGKIDIDKILSSFNKAEISALKVMQSINEEMTKKATFTSYVINGSQLKPLKNYVPQMVAQKTNQETIDEQINRIKSNINPGTESNNLIERNDFNEKNVSPVILNPYFAINQSSKSLLINYHLADPIRTARMTLKKAELNLKENKKDSEAREMLEVISQSYETALNDLLSQNFGQTNKFIDALAKVGYSAMLASAPRMLSEGISNTFFVMTNNPVDYSVGVSMYGKLAFGVDGKKVLTNLNSKVTARNYSEAGENSAMFDLSALTNRISRKGKMDTVIVNGVVQVYDNVLGRYVNLVSLVANNVVSQPDKVMIKPLWFGSFARRFEKITGETIDFNKIINNDEEYLNKYKDALSKSTDWADSQVVLAGASTNPFMGVLKNVSREDDNLYETAVKNFNRFMNKFMINEYFTIRKGVFAMIGKGDISRADGLLLLAAASQRLFLYGILTRLSSEVLVFVLRGAFNNFADMALGIDDDDEEKEVEKLKLKYDKFDDKKESYSKTLEEMMLRKIINKKEFDLMQNNKDNIQGLGEFLSEKPLTERVMQSVIGSATGMILGRNYGNFTRMWQNYLVEQVNKKYGDDLGIWDGEYDPYKDALAYNPFEGKKIDESTDLLTIISGPYAPHLNFMTTLLKAYNKSEPKEERTILTRKKERLRYFIEGSGMLNMLPFYKDFRKSAMDYVYKEVKVEKQQEVNLKEKKIDILKNIEADKNNEYEPEDLKHWIKYVEDADYKKKYDDKEEKIVDGILKDYGYKTKTEFEYEDIRGYKKEFGKYSDYSKERKGKSKIENELDDRIEAFKYGEEYTKSNRGRKIFGRRRRILRKKWG